MTQEEKQLLLIDLCARLPYGVICGIENYNGQLKLVCPNGDYCVLQNSPYAIETVKPYLRPMSSMTEEERAKLRYLEEYGDEWDIVDYFNAHHLDYRNLLARGLALEAPKDMYKTE